MGAITEDAYGHQVKWGQAQATGLAAAAVGVVTAGSIAGTTNAGAAPTVGTVNATDAAGSFVLTPVTGGGAQAAGTTATVRFSQAYAAVPRAVMVSVFTGTTVVAACAVNITAAGFDLNTTILTTATAYTVTYVVIP